jgi:hemerythrin
MFEWKQEYRVEIPEVDAQHQRLFALAEELHVARSQGKSKLILEQALRRLITYTKVHFAAEEKLMQSYGYAASAAHKREHDKLADQVVEFQNRFRQQDVCLGLDLMQFLKNWLEAHIKGSDQKYAAHIRSRAA